MKIKLEDASKSEIIKAIDTLTKFNINEFRENTERILFEIKFNAYRDRVFNTERELKLLSRISSRRPELTNKLARQNKELEELEKMLKTN